MADDFHGHTLSHLFIAILVVVAHVFRKEAIQLTTNPGNKAGFISVKHSDLSTSGTGRSLLATVLTGANMQ